MASAFPTRSSVADPTQFTQLLNSELGDYMEYQMGLEKLTALFPPEFNLLDTNGPWLEFTRTPELGRTAVDFAKHLAELGTPLDPVIVRALDERIGGAHLFVHQEKSIESILRGESVILPHPTGTGKTECFVVPVLNYLLSQIQQREKKTYGLGCIMIFPTKALENDQRDRLKEFLFTLEGAYNQRIPWMGVYDGDTPSKNEFSRFSPESRRNALWDYREECPHCHRDNLGYDMGQEYHLLWCDNGRKNSKGEPMGCGYPRPEHPNGIPWIRTTREDMGESEHYPNLLITNPEALDYRLLSNSDLNLFKTRMPRVVIVVDEAHAYDASSCLAFRALLSRLEQKLRDVNGPDIEVQYVISSATLDQPEHFARRLIPWVRAHVIEFVARPDPFPKESAANTPLEGPIAPIDPGSVDWIFGVLGQPYLESPETLTLRRLRIARLSDGVLKPGSAQVQRAWTHWSLDRASSEARELLAEAFRSELIATHQVHELFRRVQSEPATLRQLSEWWAQNWPEFSPDAAAETIASLVFVGRKVRLWTERWHLFIRSPTGFAGCTGQVFHPYRVSPDGPLQTTCPNCADGTPVLEMMTCRQCGEIYHIVYICEACEPPSLWPNPETGCGHDVAPKSAVLPRNLCVGVSNLNTLHSEATTFDRRRKSYCRTCGELLVAATRRSDQLIEMSVSLVGWHTDSLRRKFLLFSDGRASSERIAREFNNQEKLLWVERLVMEAMLGNSEHDKHDPRPIDEIRHSVNRELRAPYQRGLRPVLSRPEWERFDESLTLCTLQALGGSSYGDSRLFRMGLLGYAFPDEVLDRMRELGLEEVLPRIVDLIRLKENYPKGVGQKALFQWFTGTGDVRRQIHPTAATYLTEKAGSNHGNLQNALGVLQNCGWISRELITSHGKEETYYRFRRGESGSDPYEVARDPRLIQVPPEVSRCPTCGFIRWYRLAFCENCGSAMSVISHDKLVASDYFARILSLKPVPIVAAVHRAGLDPLERRELEEKFQAPQNQIHLLCATPTLELGVDIGYLNFVILAKVPPTRSSYIQRVGRAGRRQDEGAICVTFAYPTPVDGYYFHNPGTLVAMRSSRVPVQRLSAELLSPFIWATVLDCYAKRRSAKAVATLDGAATTRQFLELRAPMKPSELAQELCSHWDAGILPYVQAVLNRIIVPDVDQVDLAALSMAISDAKACVSNPELFSKTVLQSDVFVAQRDAIEKLHASISNAISKLRQKRNKTNEDHERLSQYEAEDDNIREYKRSHMMSFPVLRYLHDCGSIPSPRGIGGSVLAYDLQSMERVLDDRPIDMAIFDRFPGALISRQGAIYQVRRIVHDPISKAKLVECPECHTWLDDDAKDCPDHPEAKLTITDLKRPVVGFASLTAHRNRETIGLQEGRLRYRGPSLSYDDFKIGPLPATISEPADLDVAGLCRSYLIIENGRTIDVRDEILRCTNCGNLPDDDDPCCDSPRPESIVQGEEYTTRALNVRLDSAYISSRLTEIEGSMGAPLLSGAHAQVTQSLAFALLNALAIILDIEPTMLDAVRGSDNSFWVYEPVPGGFGILDDLRKDSKTLSRVFEKVRWLVSTRRGDHECDRFCDQCLLVPRKAMASVRLLNRRLLEAVVS